MKMRFKVINHTTQVVEQPQEGGDPVKVELKMGTLESVIDENDKETAGVFFEGSSATIQFGCLSPDMSKLIDTDKEFYVEFTPIN